MSIRPARFAGSWYPADPLALRDLLEAAQTAAGKQAPTPILEALNALILPHAGLRYSADLIMAGLSTLAEPDQPIKFIILAPSHYLPLDPGHLYIAPFDAMDTPLGSLEGWTLKKTQNLWQSYPQAIECEHALEMFFPCLRFWTPACQVLPVVMGEIQTQESLSQLSKAIIDLFDESQRTVLIASSDMTHYGIRFNHQPFGQSWPQNALQVKTRDTQALTILAKPDPKDFSRNMTSYAPTMCGRYPALLLAAIAQQRNWQGQIVGQYNSVEAMAAPASEWPQAVAHSSETDFVSYAAMAYVTGGS